MNLLVSQNKNMAKIQIAPSKFSQSSIQSTKFWPFQSFKFDFISISVFC